MVTFEICVNGKPLEPMECEGRGSLSASINWDRHRDNSGTLWDTIALWRHGKMTNGSDTPEWPILDLNAGDEIIIRIVELQPPNPPPKRFLMNLPTENKPNGDTA